MAYSLKQIKDVLSKKNYKFFDANRKFNLNIIGVRKDSKIPDSFDDTIYLIYRDPNNRMKVENYPVTTDPGIHWLLNPSPNTIGTAILVPGQYSGSHKIRLHNSQYPALGQKGMLTVWRDSNRDKILDFNNAVKESGSGFGINIHRSNPHTESTVVNKWSAGCTVFKRVEDFHHFMRIAESAKDAFGNSFTYTLLTEQDFKGESSNEPPTVHPALKVTSKSDKEKKAEKEMEALNAQFMELLENKINDKRLTEFLLRERDGIQNTIKILIHALKKCKDSPEKTALIEELEKEKRILMLALDHYKKKLRTMDELPPTDEIIIFLQKKNQARLNRLASINRKVALLEIAQRK